MLNFSGLPPGKYALAILHATGVPQPQQISFILAHSGNQWQLAGFFAKPMVEDGHDGLWYWVSARRFKQANGRWAAWIYYRMAANLLDPLDNLTSPNLQKLQRETDEVKPADFPSGAPVTVNSTAGPLQVTSVDTSTAFGGLDLDVHYVPDAAQAAQLSNPGDARQEVLDVMNALLAGASRASPGVSRHLGPRRPGECGLVCIGAADRPDHRRSRRREDGSVRRRSGENTLKIKTGDVKWIHRVTP